MIPMAYFASEILNHVFWGPEFWALPRAVFLAALAYHNDRIQAELDSIEETKNKSKKR